MIVYYRNSIIIVYSNGCRSRGQYRIPGGGGGETSGESSIQFWKGGQKNIKEGNKIKL